MRKYLFLFIIILISCRKQHESTCSPVTAQSEASTIAVYCNATGIAYMVDANGIYYQVVDPGSGAKPDLNSVITVKYTGSLLNGQLIDTAHTSTPITNPLNQFIEGWKIAIPYIQQGGHIKMVIPSSLAYGCTGVQNVVPSNAPIFFDVILVGVTN